MKPTRKTGQLAGKASLAIAASAVALTTLGACSSGAAAHHASFSPASVTAGNSHQKSAVASRSNDGTAKAVDAKAGSTASSPTRVTPASSSKAATTVTVTPPAMSSSSSEAPSDATVPETTIVTGGGSPGTTAAPAAVAKENNNPFWAAVQQGALAGVKAGVSEACHNIMGPPAFTCPAGN